MFYNWLQAGHLVNGAEVTSVSAEMLRILRDVIHGLRICAMNLIVRVRTGTSVLRVANLCCTTFANNLMGLSAIRNALGVYATGSYHSFFLRVHSLAGNGCVD